MFHDREDAGRQLADKLRDRPFHRPLVLGIPRGGLFLGAVLAEELHAELDVVLSRKLRAPSSPELAMGALGENGEVYLNPDMRRWIDPTGAYFEEERRYQLAEIQRRKKLYRSFRPPACLADRSVIVTDDGIATGATMIAALRVARQQQPRELLVAVPVASPDRLRDIAHHCDETVCLLAPDWFRGVGEFYEDFRQYEDDEVIELLRRFSPSEGMQKV